MVSLSIIIPCYNASNTIAATLNCILAECNQFESKVKSTIFDYEIIIVNDGSIDNTLEVLEKFVINNQIVLVNKPNSGVSDARNLGLKCASKDYIWFIDADDLLFNDAISTIVHYLEFYRPNIIKLSSITEDLKTKHKGLKGWLHS